MHKDVKGQCALFSTEIAALGGAEVVGSAVITLNPNPCTKEDRDDGSAAGGDVG
jgi:hypothetical protein